MKPTILVAGGTGNLGERIIKALIKRGAEVRAIVRNGSEPEKKELYPSWQGKQYLHSMFSFQN
jgi:uncharacterized protein YbjT (DUF2867 family)